MYHFLWVDFMAETAKILSPDANVYLPAEEAHCPMASMVSESDVFSLKEQYPDADVVSYVNTSASTKALSDICCTSANAIEIVRSCASDQVFFFQIRNCLLCRDLQIN
jgi:quinolinate synthase